MRSNKTTPLAISEDQEDELLSIVAIKGGNKHVVGSQLGVLSVWDKSKGWGDSVDRISGHPASVETLVALSEDIIATGSEDGMIRVMQVQPNKFCEFVIAVLLLSRSVRFGKGWCPLRFRSANGISGPSPSVVRWLIIPIR